MIDQDGRIDEWKDLDGLKGITEDCEPHAMPAGPGVLVGEGKLWWITILGLFLERGEEAAWKVTFAVPYWTN